MEFGRTLWVGGRVGLSFFLFRRGWYSRHKRTLGERTSAQLLPCTCRGRMRVATQERSPHKGALHFLVYYLSLRSCSFLLLFFFAWHEWGRLGAEVVRKGGARSLRCLLGFDRLAAAWL